MAADVRGEPVAGLGARPRPAQPRSRPRWRMSARLRLTLSYAAFLVVAGAAVVLGGYFVLQYVLDYPLNGTVGVLSRQQILRAVVSTSGWFLAVLAVIVLVIGLVGGWLVAGRVLRPLEAINEAARVAATGRLDVRTRLKRRGDEFGELADSFDHMLDRLHDAFEQQERFAANASHELRTPLAVTATLLDVARTAPDQTDYPALIDRLQITNRRAIELTEALLRLADANAVTATAEPVDLAELVHGVLGELASRRPHGGSRSSRSLTPPA